jgi:DNA-binding response OmpR family regulator
MDNKIFKILVVDDEAEVGEILTRYLPRKLHVEVSAIGEGSDVVETVKTLKPDLILLDMHLPGMMGWDVLRGIRKFDKAVKIIIVTAIVSVPQEDQEFILQETSGYLTKPLEIENICAKIIEVLGEDVVRR